MVAIEVLHCFPDTAGWDNSSRKQQGNSFRSGNASGKGTARVKSSGSFSAGQNRELASVQQHQHHNHFCSVLHYNTEITHTILFACRRTIRSDSCSDSGHPGKFLMPCSQQCRTSNRPKFHLRLLHLLLQMNQPNLPIVTH